jgi:hypothetical protein
VQSICTGAKKRVFHQKLAEFKTKERQTSRLAAPQKAFAIIRRPRSLAGNSQNNIHEQVAMRPRVKAESHDSIIS